MSANDLRLSIRIARNSLLSILANRPILGAHKLIWARKTLGRITVTVAQLVPAGASRSQQVPAVPLDIAQRADGERIAWHAAVPLMTVIHCSGEPKLAPPKDPSTRTLAPSRPLVLPMSGSSAAGSFGPQTSMITRIPTTRGPVFPQ